MTGFPKWSAASKVAIRPTLLYVVVGVAWILVSDWVLEISISDPEMLTRMQTFKGWFFVLFTAVLFFVATREFVSRELWLQAHLHRTEHLDALGKMASGTTHDFKNLLAIVGGSVEMLDRSRLSEQDLRTMERIDQAIQNGVQLSERLRSLATAHVDMAGVEDLNRIVRETLPLIRQAGMPVLSPRLDLVDETLLAFVERSQFEHVLLNLTINARQATKEAGPLLIRTIGVDSTDSGQIFPGVPSGRYAVVQVEDKGSGMEKSVLRRATEAFFTTKGAEGTGLGLAQANSFTRKFAGHLHIESSPGSGTCVSLVLPRLFSLDQTEDGSAEAPVTSMKPRFGGKGFTVSRT